MAPKRCRRSVRDATIVKEVPAFNRIQGADLLVSPAEEVDIVSIKEEPLVGADFLVPPVQEMDCVSIKIKEEPLVEADSPVSPEQEVDCVSIKEEPLVGADLLVPPVEDMDFVSIKKEPLGCSSLDDLLRPNIFDTDKMKKEEEEDEQAVSNDDFEEVKHELESADSDSEPESTIPVDVDDDQSSDDSGGLLTSVSLPPARGRRQEAFCGNKSGVTYPGHQCGICKEMFAHLKDLKEHMHVNGHVLLYSCSVCRKTFKMRSSLKTHFRLHTGECLYCCALCNTKFTEIWSLKRHLMFHSVERLYICSCCNKSYITNNPQMFTLCNQCVAALSSFVCYMYRASVIDGKFRNTIF